ncbi:MAG: hypothetical protein J0L79_06160 [Rickettsiales bacterium]|nr:hypothetical protein [Rickettsiales bacterium]MCA0254907.1 DUF6314 family protein [Pseudomonadota bacterium]
MNNMVQDKEINNIMSRFSGNYNFIRKISSQDPCNSFSGLGKASFSQKSNNIILYQEEVTLYNSTDKAISNMKKSYFYKYAPDNQKIQKLFIDKTLFYELIFKEGYFSGQHMCNLDQYTAKYSLANEYFNITYNIIGPEKDYEISTNYYAT